MAAGDRLLRELLPNDWRARIRGAIETLPRPLQGLFPAPDVRRQIRAHPENRDDLDPRWRERAGKPAANPQMQMARTQFILLEKELARAEFFQAPAAERDRRVFERSQVAGFAYDGMVETFPIAGMIYGKLFVDLPWDGDVNLLLGILIRAKGAHFGKDLSPLNPFVLFPPGMPDFNVWIMMYGLHASRRQWYGGIHLIPFGLTAPLFQYIGFLLDPPQPVLDPIPYAGLPDAGIIDIPAGQTDHLTFEEFEEGDNLVIIQVDAVRHIFKQALLLQWLRQQLINGEPLRNPANNVVIGLENLRRGTAHILPAPAGGRRRRQTRRRK